MGIDLDKMRAKYQALTNKGGSSDDRFWKPEEGTQVIRIVAPEDGDPFRDYMYHYRLGAEGKTTFISPRSFGQKDPIAEFGNQLWNEGTDGSKEMARKFFPRMRVFAPVVVRGEEEKGVRIWGFSKTTYEALLRLVIDPEYGDITDVHTGTDIRVDYGKKAGQMYPTTEIRPMRKTSALAEGDDAINGLLETVPSFTELFPETNYDQAHQLLQETLNAGVEDTSDGSTRYATSGKKEDTSTTDSGAVTNIDQAFDELLA